ncbi:hypothetical protein N7495_004798 [Penicillium taxi]|uniref:uncharacterized protein n=1 Tax=Penicillium taxi TaxID=168475 RepID=UPI002544E464|nr:uncharacterized protein N7495_004798 [Penicillium taxi]KAJ5900054.1 hypothetical protein N7495_004798 [Penicillium taxi]
MQLTSTALDSDHASRENLDPFEMLTCKDPGSIPVPLSNNSHDWQLMLSQSCVAPADSLPHTMESASNKGLFVDSSLEAVDFEGGIDFSSDILSSLVQTPSTHINNASRVNKSSEFCTDFALDCANSDEPPLDWSAFPDSFSTSDDHTTQSISSLYPKPHPPIFHTPTAPGPTKSSCLAESRPPCVITATENLRLLHIRQYSCLSRTNHQRHSGSQDACSLEAPRMSGSVLKDIKSVGKSVCRMLQCGCALRSQNQLIIASICSRLVVWSRAMISAYFSQHSGSRDHSNKQTTHPEKVVFQSVTIGDHTVDSLALSKSIQAQVILEELGHLQRLVNTLSVRIRQSFTLYPMELDADSDVRSAGLPKTVHDQLVAYLLKEVQTTRNDLITNWREHDKLRQRPE